jgi:hypothetical protein
MTPLEAFQSGWGWTGIEFAEVCAVSPMGHVLFSDAEACFHYFDPGLLAIQALGNEEAARAHFATEETRLVWQAVALVDAARERLGGCPEGSVYSLRPLALIEGNYRHDELCILPLAELISFTGEIARQTKDLPPGSQFRIKIVD